jgi:hypothetical protein
VDLSSVPGIVAHQLGPLVYTPRQRYGGETRRIVKPFCKRHVGFRIRRGRRQIGRELRSGFRGSDPFTCTQRHHVRSPVFFVGLQRFHLVALITLTHGNVPAMFALPDTDTVPLSVRCESLQSALPSLFAGKEAAMEAGVPLRRQEGFLYSVHQFYPSIRQGLDVLYGRGGDASAGEGVAVVRLFPTPNTTPSAADCFVVVTYKLPIVSALAVPKLITFAEKTLKPLLSGATGAS